MQMDRLIFHAIPDQYTAVQKVYLQIGCAVEYAFFFFFHKQMPLENISPGH